MKKIMLMASLALAVLYSDNVCAQHYNGDSLKGDVKKGANEVKDGAAAVGNKTAELTVKGVSAVKDNVYKGKEGPDGEVVFIDNKSRYYYINDKGGKVYISKSTLRDK